MSCIRLCEGRTAKHPLVIEEWDMRLYSVEELAYYVTENVSFCEDVLKRAGLADWLEKECGADALAEKIRETAGLGNRVERIAMLLLTWTGLVHKEECHQICAEIKRASLQSNNARRKDRADTFFVKGRYEDAIRSYEEMLEEKAYDDAKMWHNLVYNTGCCYAKMFYFDIAIEWFFRAAESSPQPGQDVMAAFFCMLLQGGGDAVAACVKEHPEYASIAGAVKKEYELLLDKWDKSEDAARIRSMGKSDGVRNADYFASLSQWLSDKKKEI